MGALRAELATQREFMHDFQLTSEDGSPRWVHLRGAIVQCDDRPTRLIAVARDVTRRKLDDLDRARFVTAAEASREAIIGTNLAGRIEVWNKAAENLYGWSFDDIRGRPVELLNPPNPSTDIAVLIERAAQGEAIGPIDVANRTRNGGPVIVNLSVVPVRDARGEVIAVSISASDVAERKKREAETRYVMRELSHRSKNLLAVVQSVAGQTARTTNDMREFQKRFSDRLAALARSHDLLVGKEWRGAMIADLVTSHVRPYIASEPGRLAARGPAQMLKPEAAQAIGMALHELASNAAKHGALFGPDGTVDVTWTVCKESETSEPILEFVWREQSGMLRPLIGNQLERGFGRDIIERLTPAALGGSGTIEWMPTGMVWHLSVPLDNVVHGPEQSSDPSSFDFGTTSPELKQLYRVWSSLRTGNCLPSAGDLQNSDIGRHGAVFVAVEIGADVSDIRLIAIGGCLEELVGGSAADVLDSPLGLALSRELARCHQSVIMDQPCYVRIATENFDRQHAYEVLVVPVASEDGSTRRFVGMVLPIET